MPSKFKDGMFYIWAIIIGGLLILMAFSGSFLKRLPLTTTIFYLAAGLLLGPLGAEYIRINPLDNLLMLERIAEIAVIISLFNAGLKLRKKLSDKAWYMPVSLATLSMIITVGLIAACGYFILNLPLGAAIILGAVLAPTDPVLASDVQLSHPGEKDRLKFTLTGEAGLNDGTVFPFIMLGLGLSGLHDIGSYGIRWLMIDVIWAIAGGLAVGAIFGSLTSIIINYLKSLHKEAVERDEFIALGLISISYGTALLIHSYGFLAVFAAGLFFGKKEDKINNKDTGLNSAKSVLLFNEQVEHILELAVVIIIGAILTYTYLPYEAFWFIPLLFLIIRPAAVIAAIIPARIKLSEQILLSWFGIRGIGSIYYLMYAIRHGIPETTAHKLISFTLIVIVVSIIIHGISVTPLMKYYNNKQQNE